MDTKYVLIIQCDIARQRCSGFACTNTFYNREDAFKEYGDDVKYISLTCGGCCGASLAVKLEHFSKRLEKKTDLTRKDVVVHLSSCMVTDNYHHDRCPHMDYIKALIKKKGYERIVEGTYISKVAQKKRETGEYHSYQEVKV
ncbi:CGGC domain-containing protein [Aminipila luticellarii]|uniref:CGGC domain-containing protein n=1 Tax=Aminipila luticellarii TaxID=2507160 RepID=A0A410PVQ8_9FIRM|nr:CGGC domain-containing protein [Aminipila luticellarii]QAT42956.1 CGGC domain-containing protein [Aminipila luticellarii]